VERGLLDRVPGRREGPVDLVYLTQFLSNVEWNWQVAEHARFMTRLASFSRLIVMDPRGIGCSDQPPPGEAATLEEKVDDVLAVMGAAVSFHAVLYGGGRDAGGTSTDLSGVGREVWTD
jgi:pimeloyl-ACP methyl ester carboxylesterase